MLNQMIKSKWLNLLDHNGDYHLYIHIPFCASKCKYCLYTGELINTKSYKEECANYINKYMPKAISNYDDILKTKAPLSFYLGGGTPNVLSVKHMKSIFDSIPNFEKIPKKVADLNPAYITKNFLMLLKEYGFTMLCFGVQSFDKETCEKNNRKHISGQKLSEIINWCKNNGIYTSVDIMCYLNYYNDKDLSILKKDLDIATSLEIDYISINPNLHFVLHNNSYANKFVSFVDDYINNIDYSPESSIRNTSVEKDGRYIYRIIHPDFKDKFCKELIYFADDFPVTDINVIGIGDLNNPHSTMSYIKNELYYVEKNIADEPYYDIKYSKVDSNINKLKNMLNKYI